MKHKLKNYLSNDKKDVTINSFDDDTIKNIIKSSCLICLLLIYAYIPILILQCIGINYSKFSFLFKIIYLTITNILFMLLLFFIYKNDLTRDFKKLKKDYKYIIKTAIKYWLIGLSIMLVSNLLISLINGGKIPSNEKNVRELLERVPVYMFFQVSIYAPFTEEIIFRKSIRNIFRNSLLYIIVSGLIFGVMHVFSDISMISILYIIPYGVLGGAFAALYNKTDNIFSSIFVHSLHNTFAFLILIISKVI